MSDKDMFQKDLADLMQKHELGELKDTQQGPFMAGMILGAWMARKAIWLSGGCG